MYEDVTNKTMMVLTLRIVRGCFIVLKMALQIQTISITNK